MKFFAHSPADVQTSFSIDNVQKGWRLAGVAPTPSVYTTLSKWPGFRAIDSDQAEQLHDDVLERLVPDVQRNGYCNPDLMYDECEKVLDVEEKELYKAAKEKAFPNVLSQWRCTLINHEGTIKKRAQMATKKIEQIAAKRKRGDDRGDEFSELTNEQLKRRCKQAGLTTGGNKGALKNRLRNWKDSASSSSSSHSLCPPSASISKRGEKVATTRLEDFVYMASSLAKIPGYEMKTSKDAEPEPEP